MKINSSSHLSGRNFPVPVFTFTRLPALMTVVAPALAVSLQVPDEHKTIQTAIDVAKAGDTVLVAPGTYRERLVLKTGVIVKSAGDDAKGKLGLRRAEATIIDGDVPGAKEPGVAMAEDSTLDGFTVTGVGKYDEALWKRHHATLGEEQSHEHIGVPGTAGIEVRHTCEVKNNVVHHVGYTGIAIIGEKGRRVSPHVFRNITYRNMGGGIGSMGGSTALIEENICFENFYAGIGHNGASPVVRGNDCYGNIRAGIGISEGSCPTVTENRCHENRRAGIGIRTGEDTRPVVEDNDCFGNHMAGIGTEEEARPFIRGNRCRDNKLAGIGCRHGARPEITDNECIANGAAGIGVEHGAVARIESNLCKGNKAAGIGVRQHAEATLTNNRILDNALVAIGVRNGSKIIAEKNTLSRKGGMPPLIAILDNSQATLIDNDLSGGGVAGVLLQGSANIENNRFHGNGPRKGGPPNFAIWVREGSEVTFSGNRVEGWRHALFASKAKQVTANDNQVRAFLGTALVIRDSELPATATGNRAFSNNTKAQAIEISGPKAKVTGNRVEKKSKK